MSVVNAISGKYNYCVENKTKIEVKLKPFLSCLDYVERPSLYTSSVLDNDEY